MARILYSLLLASLLAFIQQDALSQREKRKKGEFASISAERASEAEAFFTEGEKFFILEDYSKALLYFLRASELNPDNAAIYYKMAEVLYKSDKDEDLRKAAANIDQAIRLDKKNKYYYLLASNINNNLGQFSKSALALETMIKEVPGTEEYLYELANIYFFDKKEDEALKAYNRAEALLGINEVSSFQKQRIYLEKGKLNEAIAEGEKLIQAFPDEERYVLGLAETLAQSKQTEKAIAIVEKHLKENPESASARMMLGGLYRDNGQERKSRELVNSLFDDNHANISSKLIMLGTYNATMAQQKAKGVNDKELATFVMNLYKKLVGSNPTDANVHIVGGDIQLTMGNNEDAKAEYLKAIRLGASNFEAWQNLLYLETQENAYDSIIAHAEEALELFPNQGMIYYFNGYAHLRKKDFSIATQQLEQAKKLSVSNEALVTEINGMLGDAYQSLKEYDKSAKAYEDVLSVNPLNDLVLNNYSYYLALRKADLEKAEKMSTLLIKNHPNNVSYLDTHAWVLYSREKYKEAKKVMERAISIGNDVSSVHFEHYGDILFKLGDIEEAVAQWRKAKSMNSQNAELDKKIVNRKIF